jgi:hypothetical protein
LTASQHWTDTDFCGCSNNIQICSKVAGPSEEIPFISSIALLSVENLIKLFLIRSIRAALDRALKGVGAKKTVSKYDFNSSINSF